MTKKLVILMKPKVNQTKEEFIKEVWKWKEEKGNTILNQFPPLKEQYQKKPELLF